MHIGEQTWCVLSSEMLFEAFTPIWSHVSENEKKKKKKKLENIKNFEFYNSFKNFGREPSQE